MEIKCKVCGTINDGETNFCKGCFVKLDIEDPNVVSYNPKENEKSASIIEDNDKNIPWENSSLVEVETTTEELFAFKPIEDDYIPGVVSEENNDVQVIEEPLKFEPIDNIEKEEQDDLSLEPINDINVPIDNEIVKEDSIEVASNEEVEESKEETIFDFGNPFAVEKTTEPVIEEVETSDVVIEQPIENQESIEINETEEIIEPQIETDNEIVEENSIPEIWETEEQKNELPELDMSEFEDKDDWNEEIEEEKVENINFLNPSKLFLNFFFNCLIIGIIFGALCIGFRYLLTNMFEIGNKAELVFVVISSVTSVATLLISTDRTFKKGLPLVAKINKTTLLILFLVALPYLLIKLAYNLYIGTTFVIFLILVALTLVILAIFFNYMRTLIRSKHGITTDDKGIIIYGLFSIILVCLTLTGVYMYKDKDYNISFDILLHDSENINTVQTYINEVEKALLKNKTEIDGYEFPEKIENVEFASIDGKRPDGMVLYIDQNGKVTSGTMIIGPRVYSYDGEKIKAN